MARGFVTSSVLSSSFLTLFQSGNSANRILFLTSFSDNFCYGVRFSCSLRVNLDMSKVVYSWFIQRDEAIADTVVRSTTIPEELGRIQYLLTDKTGTLTQNEMIFKKLHLGSVSFSAETMDDVTQLPLLAYVHCTNL